MSWAGSVCWIKGGGDQRFFVICVTICVTWTKVNNDSIHTPVESCVYIYISVYIYIYVYVHIYIHIYIYIYIH